MGRTLEDIDLIFRESPSIWATVSYAKQNSGNDLLGTEDEKEGCGHEEKIETAMNDRVSD